MTQKSSMSAYMTAAATRALYDRAMRPRPSHVTPELTATLVADLEEQIAAARDYAEAMLKQGYLASADWGYKEVERLEKLRDFYQNKRKEEVTR